jgi:hypothetical protein
MPLELTSREFTTSVWRARKLYIHSPIVSFIILARLDSTDLDEINGCMKYAPTTGHDVYNTTVATWAEDVVEEKKEMNETKGKPMG